MDPRWFVSSLLLAQGKGFCPRLAEAHGLSPLSLPASNKKLLTCCSVDAGSTLPRQAETGSQPGGWFKTAGNKEKSLCAAAALALGTQHSPSSTKDGNFRTHREKKSDLYVIAGLAREF